MHEYYLLQQPIDRTVLSSARGIMGIVASVVLGAIGISALAAIGRKVFKKRSSTDELGADGDKKMPVEKRRSSIRKPADMAIMHEI